MFEDGIEVENFYDDTTSTVSNGKVTFNSGKNGTILIQTPIEEKGRVIVRHINADDETVWATETVSGNIGESYTINPLAAYGYTLSYVEGSETGTFSEEDAEVDFYYTFDSVNYAHLTVNHVDASTGNEIAEPEKSVIEIGTSYNASPKTITNYEVDLTNSDSPTGKAVQGTNTVTFRYNYVEPVCLKVHYYNANGWSNVYMYAYTGDGPTAVQLIGQWPGTAMTSEGNNWYVCTVPDVESAKVLFTASVYGPQEPGNQQPGYELSGEVWVKNGKVQTASKVNVLYVTTDGETLASETLSGLSGETYATEAKTFDNYELTGTPDNASGTFGSETITVTYTYTATTPQPEPLINTSTLSDESIELGESFTVNASAQGGTALYQYSVLYKLNKRSKWTTAQAYSDNNKIDILPEAVGTYDVCVKVKDESSTEAKNFYTITVTEKDFENTSTVSSESVVKGDTVTFTCSTSDTSGSYKYALYRMGAEDDEFVLVNDFAAVNSINAVMSEGGIYQFRVDAKSIGGTISSKVFEIRVMMPIYDVLTNTSTLSSDNIKAGESITVNASAQGGTAPYQYTVLYKLGTRSKWTTAQAYSENDTIIITPADSGQYDLCIKVKDATGKEEKLFPTITVTGGLVNTSTLPEKVSLGDTVTVNASAKGGTAPYQYAVLYKLKSRSKWTTAQAYGTNSTVNFTPAVDGAYDVCVKVKDAEGTEEKLFFDLTVEDSFRNTSTLSASSITAGSSVTVICQADGSGDTYLYYVSCKKTTDEGWTVLQSFSENSNVVFTPASSGSYSIYVEASDANGDIVGIVLELEVNDAAPLENTSVLTDECYDLGSDVEIIGSATGGTGSYQYMALYKLSTRSRWTTIQQYSSNSNMSFRPTAAGTYNVCIKVKDSRDVEVKAFMDVEVVDNSLKNYSCISASKVESGESILVVADAAGSTGFYRYSVSYKKETAGKWIIKQENKANRFVVIEPEEIGVYDICVKVTDDNGTAVRKYFKAEVTEPLDALCNTSSVSETEILLGESVTVMASASGSTGFYQYAVYYKASDSYDWTVLSDYSPNGFVIFKPESEGIYDICVSVKDNQEGEEIQTFTVGVSAPVVE